MTMTARQPERAGHYRFRHVARMEWIKLRSLRSTWWTLGITVCGATAMAVVIGVNTRNAGGDLTNNALAGVVPGLLLTGVLGVLMMTSEYTSGMIRATLAAVPARELVLAAKATVFGIVALAAGEAAAFISFAARGAAGGCQLRPGRAARPRPRRHRPAHRGRHRGAGRRGVPGGAARCRCGAGRGRVHAGADHRELADHHRTGDLPAACRAVPALPVGLG